MLHYFNPRTHMGCDNIIRPLVSVSINISIHAPTWGATIIIQKIFSDAALFQSTHPHGVRQYYSSIGECLHQYFNPRTHMGCDDKYSKDFFRCCNISIHAPTWGATEAMRSGQLTVLISIHAPTWGATDLRVLIQDNYIGFQSTHPHGVRLCAKYGDTNLIYFNPRTHMGCDQGFTAFGKIYTHFNPRTHMGCDFLCPPV